MYTRSRPVPIALSAHLVEGSPRTAVTAVQRALRRIRIQLIVVFDGEGRFDPPSGPAARRSGAFLRRLLRAIRANWPNTEILLRAGSHHCGPEVLNWCRANGVDYILGVAPTTTLRRHIEVLEVRAKTSFEATPRDGKIRRFKELIDGAKSWSRVERIISRRTRSVRPGPRRSWRGRIRHAFHRHQSEQAQPSRATRMSIADAARPKTISNPGRRTWRPIAPHARRPRPISFGCFCTAAPTG